jgi:hypothetical protein
MQDFSDFYQMGGIFNNVVSLFCLAAFTTIVLHAAGRRAQGDLPLLGLCERFVALAVASGVLGTVFNTMELYSALATIEDFQQAQASSRGMSIVPIPLAWSLMCAIPLWVATSCMRHRSPAVA